MNRKFFRALPLILALMMILSLSVSAGDTRQPTYVKEAPTSSGVGTASMALRTLSLVGGSAVDKNGKPVSGYFVWAYPDSAMALGLSNVNVSFIPTDTKTYAPCTCTVPIRAYQLSPTVKILPTVEAKLGVGKPVSELTLKGGMAVYHFDPRHPALPGHFEWMDKDQKFDEAGTYEVAVVFKPDNNRLYTDGTVTYERDNNYNFKNAFVTVTVE